MEILKHEDRRSRLSERFPWIISFSFGLLHGLGFAGALTEIGLPQGDIPAALLAFNLGVEAGQLFFVGVVLSLFCLARAAIPDPVRSLRRAHSLASGMTGYGVGALATFWLVQRVAGF